MAIGLARDSSETIVVKELLFKEARKAIEDYLKFYDMPPLRLAALKDYVGGNK